MTEEQILARAAHHAPEVGRAFAEKFRAAGGEESRQQMEKLYERLIAEQKQSTQSMIAAQQESGRMLREVLDTEIRSQRDVTLAVQTPGRAGTILYPTAGTCPKCGAPHAIGSRYCSACGGQLV